MTVSRRSGPEPEREAVRTMVQFAAPAICALLALAIRLWHLGDKSLWLDEALSWRAAHMSFTAMTSWAAGHEDTPLYYAILTFWVKIAGNSEVALRLPSVLAGALTVLVLSWAGWRIGGVLLAAAAGALLALNPAAVAFSQEARMYQLTGLFALGASVILAGFIVRPSRVRLSAYTLLVIGLVYAHYSGWVVLAVHGTLFLAYGSLHLWERRDPRVLGGGAASLTVVGIAYIPWYSQFLSAARTGVPIPEPSWDVVSSVVRASLALDQAGRYWPVLLTPLLLLAIIGVVRRRTDPMVVCLSALALVPVAMLVISLVRTPVFNLKQISPYIPGVSFVAAIGVIEAGSLVGRLGRWPWVASGVSIGAAALLAFMAFRGTIDWYDAPPTEDWRAATDNLQEAHEPVYVWQWYADVAANYYLRRSNAARPLWPPSMLSALEDGYVPVPRSHLGDQALIISHTSHVETAAILNSLRPYFSIREPTAYWGLHRYSLRTNAIASYNVGLDLGSMAWTTTPEGYLRSVSDASFSLRSGSSEDPYVLHVEYLDAGPTAFSISGFSQGLPPRPVALTTVPIAGSGAWTTADVPIKDAQQLRDTFTIAAGLTLRVLELRRYELEGASALRGEDGSLRQWFLRPDGYLETLGPSVCIWPTDRIDPTQTPRMTIEMTYLEAGAWKTIASTVPAVDGPSCPIQMPEHIVVRRIVVRPSR